MCSLTRGMCGGMCVGRRLLGQLCCSRALVVGRNSNGSDITPGMCVGCKCVWYDSRYVCVWGGEMAWST